MKKMKMDRKTLKKFALMAGEAFSNDPVYSYVIKSDILRKRFIYHFMTERFSSSNGEDIIYIDEKERGLCIWRDSENDYTVMDFMKCPHWFFLFLLWPFTLRILIIYSRRNLTVFPENTLLIEPVFVGKDFQRQGVAASLIKKGIEDLVPLGYSLGLETQNPDNIPLYEKLGFKVISEQVLKRGKIYNYSMLYMKNDNT